MQAEYHLPFRSARPLQCKAEWGDKMGMNTVKRDNVIEKGVLLIIARMITVHETKERVKEITLDATCIVECYSSKESRALHANDPLLSFHIHLLPPFPQSELLFSSFALFFLLGSFFSLYYYSHITRILFNTLCIWR